MINKSSSGFCWLAKPFPGAALTGGTYESPSRRILMETDVRASTILDAQSGVSWAAVAAGAVGAAALALLLIAFGAGLGLSAISPWSDSGVSASTFKTGTGIYLVIVAVMSSAVGGYLAARLRTRWVGVHLTRFSFETPHMAFSHGPSQRF
jgi:hypothetical protein